MPSTPAKSERRKKLRKKPLRLIYVELAFGNGGMMRDLSEEGFAVRAMMPLKQGDKTPFSFTLGDTTRIEGEGKVLWIDEGGRVAGLQFTQIAPELRSQIDDWLIEDEKITDPREAPKESRIAPAATIEELKEELRSTPVRSESSAPAVEEEAPAERKPTKDDKPPVEVHPLPPAETQKVPEPKVPPSPPPPSPEAMRPEPVASDVAEAAKKEVRLEEKLRLARQIPTPPPRKIETEASSEPNSSVTESFFRKWPKEPPSASPVAQTPAPELPTLPLPTSAAAAPPSKTHEVDDEETEDNGEHRPPLPDISEILIQPHGLSPHTEAPPQRSLDVPSAHKLRRADWEWFTLGRALAAMIVLTALVGFAVYHREVGNGFIWIGEALGGGSASNTANSPSPDGSDRQPSESVEPQRTGAVPAASAANSAPPLGGAAKNSKAPVTPLSSPESSPDSGQAEYLQAVQLMRGRNATNDRAEAVRLLWIAVEKGNPSAEVSLADLYWHGQGVVRNCDQARILFTAAARKGSSEAQKRLQQFQQEGCE